jgi:hypothetical protein
VRRERLSSPPWQGASIACGDLARATKNGRPKFATHEGIASPSIDSGGFRPPGELCIEFDA